jgi:hypothetical protein
MNSLSMFTLLLDARSGPRKFRLSTIFERRTYVKGSISSRHHPSRRQRWSAGTYQRLQFFAEDCRTVSISVVHAGAP